MTIYYVYWIHLESHTDPSSEGYIGISNDIEKRFKEHKSSGSLVGRKIRKYEDKIVLTSLFEFETREQALTEEFNLRPAYKIGWNIMTGGFAPPPVPKGTIKGSRPQVAGDNNPSKRPEVRKLISQRLKGKTKKRGYKRPEHSALLKTKIGETYPKFRGWFITPWGKFASVKECLESAPVKMNTGSLYGWCRDSEIIITKMSARSKVLRTLFNKDEIIGKTFKEIGFDYEWSA